MNYFKRHYMPAYCAYYCQCQEGELVNIDYLPGAYTYRKTALNSINRFIQADHAENSDYQFIVARTCPFSEDGKVVMVPVRIHKEEGERIPPEKTYIQEYPRWIVEEWWSENFFIPEEYIREDRFRDEFDKWLKSHTPKDTRGLSNYAVKFIAEAESLMLTAHKTQKGSTYKTLKKKLEERGCTKAQLESRTADAILDAITDNGDYAFNDIFDFKESIKEKEIALAKKEQELAEREKFLKKQEEEAHSQIAIKTKNMVDYIDEFNNSLRKCETPEGRDAMRCAQVFVNTVDVKTANDNTAFITALAMLLSNGDNGGLRQMKKVSSSCLVNKD